MWLRVLVLGAIMPDDAYGLVIVYIAMESTLAAISSYPFIKDLLVRHDPRPSIYLHFCLFFAMLALPSIFLTIFVSSIGIVTAGILISASFFNALSQITIYIIRVVDVGVYNQAKLVSSIVSTTLFLTLLPFDWAWLPVIYLSGWLILLMAAQRVVSTHENDGTGEVTNFHHFRGWLIYGSQAFLSSISTHGMRIVIAAAFSFEDVARFTKLYMLASAPLFVFAAIMVSVEAELSRATTPERIIERFRPATIISGSLVAITVANYGMLFVSDLLGIPTILFGVSLQDSSVLFLALTGFTALSGARLPVNALALASEGRAFSLFATFLGALSLGLGLIVFIPVFGLDGVGIALILGQGTELLALIIFVRIASGHASRSRNFHNRFDR